MSQIVSNTLEKVMPLPNYAQIEVTTRCNFRCGTCSRESLPKNRLNRDMTLYEFKNIHRQINTLKIVKLQGLGEPFLNKYLDEILDYCNSIGIECTTICNGSIIPNSETLGKFSNIIISIDSAYKDTFEEYRSGGNFHKIIENIKQIIQYKKDGLLKNTTIRINSVLTHLNYQEIENIYKLACELEVYKLEFVEVENWYIESQSEYLSSLDFIKESRKVSQNIKSKIDDLQTVNMPIRVGHIASTPRKNTCTWPFNNVFITVDGFITPCCIRMDPNVFNFGNIYEEEFTDIWNGDKYVSFREANLSGSKNIVCDNCPN